MNLPTSFFSFGQPVRDAYQIESEFPILQSKLTRIHFFMEGIEPSRFVSIWRDRRDLRLWYTIWMVIIFGCISVVQAFISIALSAAQVAIAKEALNLQKQDASKTLKMTS